MFKTNGTERMRIGDDDDTISFNPTQPIAGFYCIGHYRFAFQKKPNLWHRFFMRVLLNIHWKDEA